MRMVDPSIRVAIVEDEGVIRDGTEAYFKHKTVGITIVGVAATLDEAFELCQRERPDVILLDLHIKGETMSPERAVKRFLEISSASRILVVSIHDNKRIVQSMISAGVSGYCDKTGRLNIVEQGIRAVVRGDRKRPWYSPNIEQKLVYSLYENDPLLSESQQHLIRLVASGLSYDDIATELSITPGYVREQVSKIYSLLDAYELKSHTQRALANWAREHGLGPTEPR